MVESSCRGFCPAGRVSKRLEGTTYSFIMLNIITDQVTACKVFVSVHLSLVRRFKVCSGLSKGTQLKSIKPSGRVLCPNGNSHMRSDSKIEIIITTDF